MVRDGFEGLGEGVHVRLQFDKHRRWAMALQREAFDLVQIVCAHDLLGFARAAGP